MMKKRYLVSLALTTILPQLVSATSITAIYGGGNPSTGWTTTEADGIQLGLRAKNRSNGDTSNVGGVYSFVNAPAARGLWNYEFSINSDSINGTDVLSIYDYYLGADSDSSQGVNFNYVDPIYHWIDNSFGDNSTGQGAGVEPSNPGEYFGFPSLYNLTQNSQNITFGDYPGGALTLEQNATYDFTLFSVSKGAGVDGDRLASVNIQVVVGAGGTPVSDTGSTALLLVAGLGIIAGFKKRLFRS